MYVAYNTGKKPGGSHASRYLNYTQLNPTLVNMVIMTDTSFWSDMTTLLSTDYKLAMLCNTFIYVMYMYCIFW